MINTLKNAILGLAALFSLVAPAAANTYNLPTNGAPIAALVGTTFTDYFSFSLNPATAPRFNTVGVGASVAMTIDFPAPWPDVVVPPVSFSSIRLFHGTTGAPGASVFDDFFSSPYPSRLTYSGLLDAGNYFFQVTGFTTSGFGGGYMVALQAAPVPEPGEWAMMLAGLGIVTIMARRRSTKG